MKKIILGTNSPYISMIEINEASEKQLSIVQKIAHQTWPVTFSNILTPDQIKFMLSWMYDLKALEQQVNEKGHVFLLAKEDGDFLGFASYEVHCKNDTKTKIHKIYILPGTQGKGIGKKLINHIRDIALMNGDKFLYLNVNRFNESAISFYKHIGFYEAYREVIDIGNGFVMDDIVMEMKLD
ncbi:GNAT family N-acetyltransferase [Aquiflexum gelatinilyticum]|uniref:GNAT family N-acetyltransferase n=1 Tax=Aquiflexum gelatinilyticum TaxID=2961943 RepID=UPI002169FECE|nr:GNAT family N-acetyltransferase [Aquiflexum gelatinilyticum]MCS4432972.1 GNAT family N-acetyltransferase [Aquiflexum gelatinilyticum]